MVWNRWLEIGNRSLTMKIGIIEGDPTSVQMVIEFKFDPSQLAKPLWGKIKKSYLPDFELKKMYFLITRNLKIFQSVKEFGFFENLTWLPLKPLSENLVCKLPKKFQPVS